MCKLCQFVCKCQQTDTIQLMSDVNQTEMLDYLIQDLKLNFPLFLIFYFFRTILSLSIINVLFSDVLLELYGGRTDRTIKVNAYLPYLLSALILFFNLSLFLHPSNMETFRPAYFFPYVT